MLVGIPLFRNVYAPSALCSLYWYLYQQRDVLLQGIFIFPVNFKSCCVFFSYREEPGINNEVKLKVFVWESFYHFNQRTQTLPFYLVP